MLDFHNLKKRRNDFLQFNLTIIIVEYEFYKKTFCEPQIYHAK